MLLLWANTWFVNNPVMVGRKKGDGDDEALVILWWWYITNYQLYD
jgi:hypothetical protein